MGLDVSHGAWSGAYSSFHTWRVALATAAGGRLEPHPDVPWMAKYTYDRAAFDTELQERGFDTLMQHSDCDGRISPQMCKHVADALEHLLPKLARSGEMTDRTVRFIEGCRRAHARGEYLDFH